MNKIYRKFTALKSIYPPFLVLLIFFPLLTGAFINYDLFHSRDILIYLIWLPFLTSINIFFKKKLIYKGLILLIFLLGFIEVFHWIVLKGPITITSLLVLSNTNYQEAKEFMSVKATFGLLILILYVFIFLLAYRFPPKLEEVERKQHKFRGLILIFSSLFLIENIYSGRFIRKATPQIIRVTYAFYNQMSLYKSALKGNEPKELTDINFSGAKQQTFVLILGESCSRRHMSLYNDLKKTNPKLSKRKDIITYTNAVSPFSNTVESVLAMLSESNLQERKLISDCVDIIDVFHSSGFKTYWISNQSPIGIWENSITSFSKKSDQIKFVNTTGNNSFETNENVSYDEKIFNPFIRVIHEEPIKKFVVIHLMGSHTSYKRRYPGSFNHFKGSSQKEQTIAEYDNSVLYNDFIVDSLLNIMSSIGGGDEISSAIYISDHGENVYDEFDKIGHDFIENLPKVNVEVPFLVWLSTSYKRKYPNKVREMKLNIHFPFVTDDLFHAIMDLNAIDGSVFKKRNSIFNKEFNQHRIRTLEDGRDYDSN